MQYRALKVIESMIAFIALKTSINSGDTCCTYWNQCESYQTALSITLTAIMNAAEATPVQAWCLARVQYSQTQMIMISASILRLDCRPHAAMAVLRHGPLPRPCSGPAAQSCPKPNWPSSCASLFLQAKQCRAAAVRRRRRRLRPRSLRDPLQPPTPACRKVPTPGRYCHCPAATALLPLQKTHNRRRSADCQPACCPSLANLAVSYEILYETELAQTFLAISAGAKVGGQPMEHIPRAPPLSRQFAPLFSLKGSICCLVTVRAVRVRRVVAACSGGRGDPLRHCPGNSRTQSPPLDRTSSRRGARLGWRRSLTGGNHAAGRAPAPGAPAAWSSARRAAAAAAAARTSAGAQARGAVYAATSSAAHPSPPCA